MSARDDEEERELGNCPHCGGELHVDNSPLGSCDNCKLFGCAHCGRFVSWDEGGEYDSLCADCWCEGWDRAGRDKRAADSRNRSPSSAPAGSTGGGVPVPGPETVPGAGAGTLLPSPPLVSDMDPQSCDAGGGGVFFHFVADELATAIAALKAHETYLLLLAEMARGGHRQAVREETRAVTLLIERLLAAGAGSVETAESEVVTH